jgi:Concanavalin A-like lectin/glucanases superfamily
MSRISSLLLLIAVSACAQVQVEFPPCFSGTSGVSGCQTPGIRYNDNSGGSFLFGDTWLFTAKVSGGNWYGQWNDGYINGSPTISVIPVVGLKMTALDLTSASNTLISGWTDSTFNSAYNIASGSLNSAPNCAGGLCTVKSTGPFAMAGCVYWPIVLQGTGNTYGDSHATIIKTCNPASSPPTWVNPSHVGGSPVANGDPPTWNTASPGSDIMWPATAGAVNKLSRMVAVQPADWQDDGSHCPTIPTSAGGDGAGTYAYFFSKSTGAYSSSGARLYGPFRVTCANLPNLDKTQWEAWDGAAWTSTLSSAATAASLGWWDNSTFGTGSGTSLGTSPTITYLPDFGTFVLLGQHCLNCSGSLQNGLNTNGYRPSLVLSQATSLTGTWTVDQGGRGWTGLYQYATNPTTQKLNANVNINDVSITTTISYSTANFPGVPFPITIGAETLTVTAASGTTWTVSAATATHSSGDQITVAYPLRPQTAAFVQGTYSYSNGVATMTLGYEGDALSDSGTSPNNAQLKAHNVYGPYFSTLRFLRRPAGVGSNQVGNVPLRFTGNASRYGLPASGLQWAWDFYDHAGFNFGAFGNELGMLYAQDQVTKTRCTPAQSSGGGTFAWSSTGMLFASNNATQDYRCQTTANWPITGSGARTVISIFNMSSLTGGPMMFSSTTHNNDAEANFFVSATGSLRTSVGGASTILGSATSVISTGTWYVGGYTYSSGTLEAGGTMYLNGAASCGAQMSTVCTTTSTHTPNTGTTTIRFGGDSIYGQFFNGTLAGVYVWNRALTRAEMSQACTALKYQYRNRITLTCN